MIVVDCATTGEDVDGYIVPALKKAEIEFSDVTMLVLTHQHSDHAGRLSRLLSLIPNTDLIRDIRELFDGCESGIFHCPVAVHDKSSLINSSISRSLPPLLLALSPTGCVRKNFPTSNAHRAHNQYTKFNSYYSNKKAPTDWLMLFYCVVPPI